MKKTLPKLLPLILSLLIILTAPLSSFAEGGDGSGGGKNNPLTITKQSIEDKATDVSVDAEIILDFSKNVVNASVNENNQKCFELVDSQKNTVAIEILTEDDQLYPDKRRQIIVKPEKSLNPNTTYTLTISGDLASKSGNKLNTPQTITFTTADSKATNDNKKAEENTEATDKNNNENIGTVDDSTTTEDSASVKSNGINPIIVVVGIVAVAIIAIAVIIKKKN